MCCYQVKYGTNETFLLTHPLSSSHYWCIVREGVGNKEKSKGRLHSDWSHHNLVCCWNITQYLISEPQSTTGSNGWTPLHLACATGHLNITQHLISELQCLNQYNSVWTHTEAICLNMKATVYMSSEGTQRRGSLELKTAHSHTFLLRPTLSTTCTTTQQLRTDITQRGQF